MPVVGCPVLIPNIVLPGLDIYDSESESSGNEENDNRGLDSDEELKVRYFVVDYRFKYVPVLFSNGYLKVFEFGNFEE